MGCADAEFSLKSMLKSRREHGIDSFIEFSFLVKSFDSMYHDFIPIALLKMISPTKCAKWVEKMHGDFNAPLNLEKEEIVIRCGCEARKGDNLEPFLIILVLQLVAE